MNNLGHIRAPLNPGSFKFSRVLPTSSCHCLSPRERPEKLQICLRESRPRRCDGLHDYPRSFSERRGEGQLRALCGRKDGYRARWLEEKRIKCVSEVRERAADQSSVLSLALVFVFFPAPLSTVPHFRLILQPATFFPYVDMIPQPLRRFPRRHRAHTCVIRTRVSEKDNVSRGSSYSLAIPTTFSDFASVD